MPEGKIEKFIDIAMPEIYAGMQSATITFWTFEEDEVDLIVPGDQLLRVETEEAFFNISVPPWVTTRCRVKEVYKQAGEHVKPGDLLIRLEPLETVDEQVGQESL